MADYSYYGSGKVYIKQTGSAAGLVEVGNCSSLKFSVNEDSKTLKNYTQPGGGTYNEIKRVDSVEAAITFTDLSSTNLARALFGSVTAVTSGAVTAEQQTAYKGAFVPTNNPASAITTVKNQAGSTTYVLNTDYQVVPGGILIIAAGAITDAQIITIDYTKAVSNIVEALLSSSQEWEIFFAGINEARSGKAVNVHAYRVKLGAAKDIDFLADDFASLDVGGKVLPDSTKNGTTVSQYFNVAIVT